MSFQAGVRPKRTEWVQETTEGVAPDDIDWNLFSDNMTSQFDWEPDANTTRQDALGEVYAQGFFNGAETHDISFEYDFQQWFYDGSGNTLDASGDFLEASADNSLKATHTIVSWSEQSDGGAGDNGRYIVTVAKGSHPDSVTVPFETEDGSPIALGPSYQAEKVRQFSLDQPDSGGEVLTIANNGSSDVDVAVENYDGSQQETLTVTAGGTADTSETYSSLGAVEKQSDVDGTVEVQDTDSNVLLTLYGSDAYPAGEGDLGIPTTGSGGSHASAIGSEYIRFIDDTLTVPNITGEYELISGELEVDTGLDSNTKTGGASQNIHNTTWTYTITATLAGERVSVDQISNYLREVTGTITWDANTDGSIDFNNAFIQSPGTVTDEAGNGKNQYDNEFQAETITVN